MVCKGILGDLTKQMDLMKLTFSQEQKEMIAQKTEDFIVQIIEESSEICFNDKRKIITEDDVKKAIENRGIEFLNFIFE